ncbi:MAG: hypothetical protein RLZ69_778, partial [Actinomycetota bacterium]
MAATEKPAESIKSEAVAATPAVVPTPAAVPAPVAVPTPAAAKPAAAAAKPSASFGRVDDENNVFVTEAGVERKVGQYPNVTAAEALAFFERKYADLAAQVRLLEQRVAA